jgi:hypothetical protein
MGRGVLNCPPFTQLSAPLRSLLTQAQFAQLMRLRTPDLRQREEGLWVGHQPARHLDQGRGGSSERPLECDA